MRRGYIDTPEGQVFYLEHGAGEPLVLLHQSPRSSSMWLDVMPLLADQYRVLAIDMLGYGLSDPAPVKDGKADVAAIGRSAVHLLDALGIKHSHLCGFHTGAYMAAHAVVEGGDRFKSLALFGYPHIESDAEYEQFFAKREMGLSRYQNPGTSADGSHLITVWMIAYGQVMKNWLLTGGPADPDAKEPNLRTPTPHRHAHTFMTDHDMEFIERYVADHRRAKLIAPIYKVMIAPSSDLICKIKIPTRVVDLATQHESTFCRRGQKMAAIMQSCEATSLENYDDNVAEFSPQVFVAELVSFLRKHPLRN